MGVGERETNVCVCACIFYHLISEVFVITFFSFALHLHLVSLATGCHCSGVMGNGPTFFVVLLFDARKAERKNEKEEEKNWREKNFLHFRTEF